jgi:hypothetical protein
MLVPMMQQRLRTGVHTTFQHKRDCCVNRGDWIREPGEVCHNRVFGTLRV